MYKNLDTIKDFINFDKKDYNNFLFNDYKSYLKIQWLTTDTKKFYMEYIYRFIKYSNIESISDFDSILKLKVWYNK
jgi:hypothetical protein